MIQEWIDRLINIVEVRNFPILLIGVIFTNRYLVGGVLLWLTKLKEGKKRRVTWLRLPRVCVTIPMYNEGESIQGTIRSVQAQDYPNHLLSYIIIDDNSKDASATFAEAAIGEDTRGTVLRNKNNMGKRMGLVRAVRMTDADLIVSVDSDVYLKPNVISELVGQFRDPEIAAVGGRVCVYNANQNWLTMMQTIKYFIGYDFLKGLENAFGSVMCLSGCLTAYRRHALIKVESKLIGRRIGQIRIKYGEDRYLTRQLVQMGFKTHLHRGAVCFTKAPYQLSTFFSQQMRWRRSNIVDFMQGTLNAWRLHPMVALHYFSLASIFLIYPMYVLMSFMSHKFGTALLLHMGILTLLSMHYWVSNRDLPDEFRVPPVSFLAMAIVMPVTYLLLTPVAFFTLDTGSWETRKM